MAINDDLIHELMRAVRVKSEFAEVEITELIEACVRDLEIAGVYITDETDGLARQALKLYCKANYGYDENTERLYGLIR